MANGDIKLLLFTCHVIKFFSDFRYAQSVGAKHYDTSAKLDTGVSDMMLDLTKRSYLSSYN